MPFKGPASHSKSIPNPELFDFTHRFLLGVALSIPLLVLAMGPMLGFLFFTDLLGERASLWLEFALATPVVGLAVLRAWLFSHSAR